MRQVDAIRYPPGKVGMKLCQQCSIDQWGEDKRDLAGMTTTVTLSLCEGCGVVQVDANGKCVDSGCPVHGKKLRTTEK